MITQPRFTFAVQNYSTTLVTSSFGDVLTADASTPHVQGAKVEILSGAELTSAIDEITLIVTEGYTAGSDTETLLELFIDTAGGTSYTSWVPEFQIGKADTIGNGGGRRFLLRRHAPAGSSIAAAIRSSVLSQTTYLAVRAYGNPAEPIRQGTIVEGFGTITNSSGLSLTPGTSGTKGSWTEVGTTTTALWWWIASLSWNDSSLLSQTYWMDIAFGDATNKSIIARDIMFVNNSTRDSCTSPGPFYNYCPVPAGVKLYARCCCSSGTADSAANVRIIGFGG